MTDFEESDDILRRLLNVRGQRRNRRKFLNSYTHDEFPMSTISKTNPELFLAASDISDLITSKLLLKRIDKNTMVREATLLATNAHWVDFVNKTFGVDERYQVVHHSPNAMLVIDRVSHCWIRASLNSNAISCSFHGDIAEIDHMIGICSKRFDIAQSYIEWIFTADGGSVNVPLRTDRVPLTEMYPFLAGKTIEQYYDQFLNSDASILLLIGPPGTGKTTFIRGFLQHTKSSAVVTYDANILSKDYVFAQFIEGEANVMVMEDADNFLKARNDGNTMMHRFLNVGDGLVTTKGKKLIFSTNLPSIRDVDQALIRPGRCFDVVAFEPLNQQQAETVAQRVGVTIGKKDKWSIAEIFNEDTPKHNDKQIGRGVGFI